MGLKTTVLCFVISAQMLIGSMSDAFAAPNFCNRICPEGTTLHLLSCRCQRASLPSRSLSRRRCPVSSCPRNCPSGITLRTDRNGCKTCTCGWASDAVCRSPICRNICPFDYVKDSRGCDTCSCQVPRCQPLGCFMNCPNGLAKDENGCDMCKCKSSPTPADCGPVCYMFCPYGNVLDDRGCPTCRCHLGPAVS